MKNIETILSDFGITIPEGKAADLRKAVAEHNEVCRILTEIGQLRKTPNCRNAATRWTHR